MFGILNRAFLPPLPFPERAGSSWGEPPWTDISTPGSREPTTSTTGIRPPCSTSWRRSFPSPPSTGSPVAERPSAHRQGSLSVNLFGALGVRPALGRGFRREDGLEGAANVVMVSQGFWQRHFGGDPDVVGRSLSLNGEPYTVVGVLPAGFFFMYRADLWIPLRPDRFTASARDMYNWYLVGRMRPGVTLAQAQTEMDLISARLEKAYPETNRDKGLLLTDLQEALVEDYRPTLLILTGAVALVLLIACGNGAGILLARAPARQLRSVRALGPGCTPRAPRRGSSWQRAWGWPWPGGSWAPSWRRGSSG